MASQNQLSRYGAISRLVPELAPSAKVFLVGDSDDTSASAAILGSIYPADEDGVVRVYSTIQAAVNACTANRGDVVLVMPGYNQSLSRADSWNVAGAQIIGLGSGSSRPTITYDDTAATVTLGANGIRVSNLRFLASASRTTRALDMDTFVGQRVDNCVFTFDATGDDFVTSIRLGASESIVEDNQILMEDTAGPRQGIAILGGNPDFSTIRGNYLVGHFDTVADTSNSHGAISQDTSDTSDTNLTGLLIKDNTILSLDTAAGQLIRFSAGFTNKAMVVGNRMASWDSATADTALITVDAALFVDNKIKRNDTTEKLVADSFVAAA